MSYLYGKRILVTGGAGFLGKEVCPALEQFSPAQIIVPRSADSDLRERVAIRRLLEKERPEVVIHLAAVVGGIGANRENPGRYFYDNAAMAIHLMEESRLAGVQKFVSLGTICSYPKYTPVPFKEEDLWNGYPEETNAPYGLAKKMLLVQGQAYREQYDFNAITLLPVNLYGPGDNFDPSSSHVIPALIRKVLEAKDEGSDHIEVWGTGTASREFFFVRDAARAIALAAEGYNKPEPVNLGSGHEVTIRELTELICDLCGFGGQIIWDSSKPDGQPRRCLNTTRAKQELGFAASTSLRDGLMETIEWYERSRVESQEPRAEGGEQENQSETGNQESAIRLRALDSQLATLDSPARRAVVTGIAGQDGSYLAELLLGKGYEVHGIVRRSSSITRSRLDALSVAPEVRRKNLVLHYGDLTDPHSLMNLVLDVEPDEIYNLGAQSHVRVSFDNPLYTINVGATGAFSVLEAARLLSKRKDVRFYQASTSEMFGGDPETAPQSETTPFHPRSPYACAKVFAHHQTVNYREAYDMYACCGILFNHESPRRGETFVTRKITRAAARIKEGLQDKLYMGNLDAKRDWGYAKDYVEGMWRMLQQEEPDDYVIATGETHTVEEFLESAFAHLDLQWRDYVEIDPRFFRPSEVDLLLGDPAKAREKLGWEPHTPFQELVKIMVETDWRLAKSEGVTKTRKAA